MSRSLASSRVLAGGGAPAFHRRELARAASSLDFARWMCAWLEDFIALHPSLLDGPLYGDCLAQLAANVEVPCESVEKPGRRSRFARREPDAPPDRCGLLPSERSSSSSQGASARPLAKPSQKSPVPRGETGRKAASILPPVPRRADLDLLRRVTGKTRVADTSAPRRQTVENSPRRNAEASPPILRDPQSVSQWLRDLGEHASHRLSSHGSDRPDPVEGDRPDPAERAEYRFLSDQWSLTLSGQVAPAHLLVRLAGDYFPDGQYCNRGATVKRSQTLRPLRGSEESPRMAGSLDSADIVAEKNGAAAQENLSADTDDLRVPSRQSSASFPETPWPLGPNLTLQSKVPPSIASMAEAPMMPSLLPRQVAGLPDAPIAAAIIRQGLIAEQTVGREDDLTELSAKIRRILEEEARRHGIDV